jgi:HK97 family phage portal protein
MSIFSKRLREQRATSMSIGHPRDSIIAEYYGGYPSSSGVTVSEWTALNFSAVYRAVQLVSGCVSTLPFNLYRRAESDFSDPVTDHPTWWLLNVAPNPEMDAAAFRESLTGHANTWGNGYAEIETNGAGKPHYLWPIRPDRVRPDRLPNGNIVYNVTRPNGGNDPLPPERMLHIHGFGYDGLMGYAVIRLAREAIGLGLATEQYGATFFGNGARPGGVLTTPKSLSDTAQDNLRRSWNNIHQGPQSANKLGILEDGVTWQQIGLPNEDAQFLQTRAFQIREIARWFGVPPHLLGDLDRATFSNIEQQSLEFLMYCLSYWFKRWEASCFLKLFDQGEQHEFILAHDPDELVRADLKTRTDADKSDVDTGIKSVNQVRRSRGLASIGPAGDIFRLPLNMADAKKVATQDSEPAKPESVESDEPESHGTPQDAAAVSDLQGTALNGAQIAALLQITGQVASGELAPKAAKALISVSFPLMGAAKIDAIVDAIEEIGPKAEPTPVDPDEPQGASRGPDPDRLREKGQAIVDDVMQRMLHLEKIAVRRAAEKPGQFLNWLESYYQAFELRCREALQPASELLALLDGRLSCGTVAIEIASRHCNEHRAALLAAAGEATADRLPERIASLTLDWEYRYNPDQPRDERGRFGAGGGDSPRGDKAIEQIRQRLLELDGGMTYNAVRC